MNEARRFPFVDANPSQPGTSLLPLLPLVLSHGGKQIDVIGLLDTGAAVNVLPYSSGEQLGLVWQEQKTPLALPEGATTLDLRRQLLARVPSHVTNHDPRLHVRS